MTRLKEGIVRALYAVRRFVRNHRVAVVSTSTLLIVAMVVQVAFFYKPKQAEATVEVFTTAGTASWTAPAGVTSVMIECWGGGGGGGAGNTSGGYGGGGGGGGAYSRVNSYSVTPGNSYSYTVGAPGAGNTTTIGDTGGNSSFNTNICVAQGGDGGQPGDATTGFGGGAPGGSSVNGIGDVKYNGGAGGSGATDASGGGGGGGGSAATSTAAGNNASSGSGTTGGAGGAVASGPGGAGGAGGNDGTNGSNGSIAGGGGGGGGERDGGAERGGDGAVGKIQITYTADSTPPSPNPYFTTAPIPDSTSQISMTSVTITDSSAPVNYFFTSTTGTCGGNLGTGGTNSGWQSSASYSDSGLQVNKCYAYTVTGKDAANNRTATSTASTTYTLAATPGGPTYSSVGVTSITFSNTENGNPTSGPATYYVVRASSTDSGWNNKYLTASSPATSTTPTWLTDTQLNSLVLSSLRPNTRYDFESIARNQNQVLTATSTRTGTTTLPDTAAPTPNPATFSSAPNDASATSISMTSTAGSDAAGSTPISYYFDYTGACASNNGTGGTDSGWLVSTVSYTDDTLEVNKCYSYTVQMRDALSNTGTVSSAAQAYTAANVPSAPTLSNAGESTFDIDNNANGNPSNTEFAAMVTSSDGDWNNKYIDTDGTSSDIKVWMSDTTLDTVTVTGLDFSTSYTVKVMARNGDNEETASSTTANISTAADGTAPASPTFSSAPSNDSVSQISMTTNSVSDPSSPVEYFFDAVAGSCGANLGANGTDSAWQEGLGYSDSGLDTNKCYAYTVSARDANANTSAASAVSQTYTSAAVPGVPTQVSVTDETITLSINANGNPASNPTTYFAIQVSATTDGTWLNQYADASGNANASAQWLTAAQLTNFTVQGLQPSTSYTFRVKARNQDTDETSFGSTATMTTESISSPGVPETRIQGGTRLQGIRIY